MSDHAKVAGSGFIELLDAQPANGSHFLRAEHITAIRPAWDKHEDWIGCHVHTLDGTSRLVNASFEDIAAAIDEVCGSRT
jgi:hypothetical protein